MSARKSCSLSLGQWSSFRAVPADNPSSAHILVWSRKTKRPDISQLQTWMMAHPEADLSVPALADRMAMSPRSFSRLFHSETGDTPAQFAERVRADAARCKLEQTILPVETIAEECGFGNAGTHAAHFSAPLRHQSSGLPGAVSINSDHLTQEANYQRPLFIADSGNNLSQQISNKIREKPHAHSLFDLGA